MAKQPKAPEVYKFGGASLGDGNAFKHAAAIVKQCAGPLVAVCSAPAGVTDLLLWVLEDNHDAQRAYEALGFEPTGERQFLPDLGRFERRLRLGIGPT